MIAGGLMFAPSGQGPGGGDPHRSFWDPLFSDQFADYSRPQLLVKAGPLILIAIGLSLGFRAGCLEHRGGGAIHHRRHRRGRGGRSAFHPADLWIIFPLIDRRRGARRVSLGDDPRASEDPVQDQRDSRLAPFSSTWPKQVLAAALDGLSAQPRRGRAFPARANLAQYPAAANTEIIPGHRDALGAWRRRSSR